MMIDFVQASLNLMQPGDACQFMLDGRTIVVSHSRAHSRELAPFGVMIDDLPTAWLSKSHVIAHIQTAPGQPVLISESRLSEDKS